MSTVFPSLPEPDRHYPFGLVEATWADQNINDIVAAILMDPVKVDTNTRGTKRGPFPCRTQSKLPNGSVEIWCSPVGCELCPFLTD